MKKKKKTDALFVSREVLSHFRCGECAGWWSIGDAPKRKLWFCPWCGMNGSTQKKK
ncbi:MAG: hypothetical protein WDZ88_00395 [Candidatus Paceibacterota bacterium]